MPEFGDMVKNQYLAAFIRFALFLFGVTGGIAVYIIETDVESVLHKVEAIESKTIELGTTANKAKDAADEAHASAETVRTESTRRFDSLETSIRDQELKYDTDHLQIYKLQIQVGCLERKTICPPPQP